MLPVEYISIAFANLTPVIHPAVGTKFIVDDVALNGNLSVGENELDNVSLYPNPANHSFVIPGDLHSNEVSVTDLNGSDVPFEMVNGKVNTASWKNGCYFVHFTDGQSIFTKRIIVSH